MEAAIDVFYEKGIERTTIAEISKLAGLTQPALYIYFENKMSILREVIIHSVQKGRELIEATIDPRSKPLDQLDGYILGNLDFFRKQKKYAHSIMALYYFAISTKELADVFENIVEKSVESIETYLIQASYQNSIQKKNTANLARMIHQVLIGGCYASIYASTESEFKENSRNTLRAVHTILGNHE